MSATQLTNSIYQTQTRSSPLSPQEMQVIAAFNSTQHEVSKFNNLAETQLEASTSSKDSAHISHASAESKPPKTRTLQLKHPHQQSMENNEADGVQEAAKICVAQPFQGDSKVQTIKI